MWRVAFNANNSTGKSTYSRFCFTFGDYFDLKIMNFTHSVRMLIDFYQDTNN